jgi:predicted nucleic acid-binding protein
MVHFDTNYLVAAIRTGSPQATQLDAWLAAKETVGMSAVAWAEFLCGPVSARDEVTARQMFRQVEAFSGQDAEMAARLFNKTGRRSKTLADCMIAAVAMRCSAKLATVNAPDFQPFVPHGLILA